MPRRALVCLVVCTWFAFFSCKAKDNQSNPEPASDYGQPVGARITGNGKLPSFEIALAAHGVTPDNCLPQAVQAVTSTLSGCSAFSDALGRQGGLAVTFQTKQQKLVPNLVQSEGLDDTGLSCLRRELEKVISCTAMDRDAKFLLQIRPVAG